MGTAQVHQGHVQTGQPLQHLERVVARAAADIEQVARGRGGRGGGLGDQFQGQGGIDGGRLPRFEVGKTLHIRVEAGADFIDGGFHGIKRFGRHA